VSDIVEQLRASVTQCRAVDRSALLAAAADEIERLRLTDEEREAIERGMCALDGVQDMSAECVRWDAEAVATLRSLLERTK
jgi:hypothetical protein